MLFQDEETARLKSIIARQARALTAKEIDDLLSVGKRQKPTGFDRVVGGLQQRYAGDQIDIVRSALRQAYPDTYAQIPVEPLNWLALFARQDSGATDGVVAYLEDESGEALDAEDDRAVAFSEAVDIDGISLQTLAPDCEQITLTGARSVAVLVGWRKTGPDDPGRMVAHVYWPHDVVAIAHPSAPDDERSLYIVALKQAKVDSASEVWWVWSRDYEQDDQGNVTSWSPWQHCRISTDGKHSTLPQPYPGKLPVSFCRIEQSAGGFWPSPDRDIASVVDGLNVRRANHAHVLDMQAHGQVAIAGSVDVGDLPAGPSKWVTLPPNTTASVLNYGADFPAMASGRELDLRETGITRGQSPDAYAPTSSGNQSGVSRMIANAPHDARLDQLRPKFKRWLESSLLPIVVDVLDLFHPTVTMGAVTPSVHMARAKAYEDPEALQRRVDGLLSAGLISKARAAVMLGVYDDEDEAIAALGPGSDQIGGARQSVSTVPGQAGPSPFTAMRETTSSDVNTNGADE